MVMKWRKIRKESTGASFHMPGMQETRKNIRQFANGLRRLRSVIRPKTTSKSTFEPETTRQNGKHSFASVGHWLVGCNSSR